MDRRSTVKLTSPSITSPLEWKMVGLCTISISPGCSFLDRWNSGLSAKAAIALHPIMTCSINRHWNLQPWLIDKYRGVGYCKFCPRQTLPKAITQHNLSTCAYAMKVHVCRSKHGAAERVTGAKWGHKCVVHSMHWSWHEHMNALVLIWAHECIGHGYWDINALVHDMMTWMHMSVQH